MTRKRSLLMIFALIVMLPVAFVLTACGTRKAYNSPKNIIQSLPDQIHIEYNTSDYSHGLIFVKDGNEYYINGKNKWHATRREIYMKTNLTQEVCKDERGNGWGLISAHWNGSTWILAADETSYTSSNAVWHANADNQDTYSQTESITRTGYSDINTPILDHVTITQLENQTVTLRSGQEVECEVWDYQFENGSTYAHYRYWYAVGTGVYIKSKKAFDQNVDIETDGSSGENIATYYKVGDDMDAALSVVSTHIGETRTKYVFDAKYK